MEKVKTFNISDKKKNRIKEYLFIYSAIIIQLTVFAVFYVYVNINSVKMAFQVTIQGKTIWTLENFKDFFKSFTTVLEGENMWIATKNTFIFFIIHQLLFPIAFVNSYFLYKKIPGHKVYRIAFFIPSVLSSVVWSALYKDIVGTNGPIAILIQKMNGLNAPPRLLGDPKYALTFVALYSVWFGLISGFVLYSGTFSRIPNEIIEVGNLEGITWTQELVKVVVPLVWPTVSTVFLLGLMGLFTSSGNILLLTGGAYDTNTLSFYLFSQVYGKPETSNSYNYASAIGLLLTALTLPIVFGVTKLTNKVENVEF